MIRHSPLVSSHLLFLSYNKEFLPGATRQTNPTITVALPIIELRFRVILLNIRVASFVVGFLLTLRLYHRIGPLSTDESDQNIHTFTLQPIEPLSLF